MRVLVSDPVSDQGVAILREQFEVDVITKLPPEELIRIIPEYDGLVVRSETKVTAEVLDAAVNLKVIGRAGVGVDNIDVPHATRCGIIVLNAPEGNTMAATEHSVALMMALARNIPQAYKSMSEGKWERAKFMGIELRGKTLGIFGLGRIGTGVAKRALALEMKVMAYDPFINLDTVNALGIEAAEIDEILARADFISLHLPKTQQTLDMINKDAFAKMKKGMRIINCARGGVVNEADLVTAVQEGIVAGAALDVFGKEPINPDDPLLSLPQIITTPHLGASTVEAQVGVAVDVAYGVIAALKGEPVTTAVNMAAVPSHILKQIQPYFHLAECLGRLAMQLAAGRLQKVTVEYNGEISQTDTKMLSANVLKGIFDFILQEGNPVNMVNAPGIAKARGVEVNEIKHQESNSFTNLMTVRLQTDTSEHVVAGTLFGDESRIVYIDGHRVEADPVDYILVCPHEDRPGMVGQVGTTLGLAGININGMQVSRADDKGISLMVLSVDGDVPQKVLHQVQETAGILDAKVFNFKPVIAQ